MKVKVIEKSNKYFAIFSCPSSNIPDKIIIKKSWDSSFSKEVILNYNIFDEEINILEKDIDLLNFEFELNKLNNFYEYYKLEIINEEKVFPLYIDFNLFYNIKQTEQIYFYEYEKEIETNSSNKYIFYILGNYGDKHLINIIQKIGKKLMFRIPEKDKLKSEIYYIVIEKNGEKLIKDTFGLYLDSNPIKFLVNLEDFGSYYKCSINTKHKYGFIKNIDIQYDNKIINMQNNYGTYLFIPKTDFSKPIEIKIKATIRENYIDAEDEIKEFLIIKNLSSNKQISIDNFQSNYNFDIDTYQLSWNSNTLEETSYKLVIDNKHEIYCENNSIMLNNFSFYNNNLRNLKIDIYSGFNNIFYLIKTFYIDNPYFLNKSNNFTPEIDYSDYINTKEQEGLISWSTPNFTYYSLVKIKVNFYNNFLDENLKPWLSLEQLALEKTCLEFEKIYPDEEKEYYYDFENNIYTLKGKYKNGSINYNNNIDYVFLGQTNNIKLPKWFIDKNAKITFEVKILDYWKKECGYKKIEFGIPTKSNKLLDEDFRIIRNQFLQFGEKGTIGYFNSLNNIGPLECEKFYSENNKTFLEEPLFDYINTDFNNNSLYFYFNNKSSKTIDLKFKRSSNHKLLKIKITKNNNIILEHTLKFLGNNFNDNIYKINRNKFNEEGEYIMSLTSVNPYNLDSEEKIVNFFVYNEKPKLPLFRIPLEQHKIENGKITINKKQFSIDIINNSKSERYAGWDFREVHFFFKTNDSQSVYNNYPDYLIQASKEYGTIRMTNITPFDVGNYKCKIIAYDYAGNPSDINEFEFNLIPEMIVRPEKELTNNIYEKFRWDIRKSENSDGYFYSLGYSPDGVQEYELQSFAKVNDSYYLNNPLDKEWTTLKLDWLKDGNKVKLGYYKLFVNEWNYRNENGVLKEDGTRLLFESVPVIVNKIGNPSNPIYSKQIDKKVAVFNIRKSNEYSYTNDLDNLIFNTIHDEPIIDENPQGKSEEDIKGKLYKITLMPPSKNKTYSCRLPIPTQLGTYSFNNIATKCNITEQEEGVWELRFITRDAAGNINESNGYYSYKIILVKREPKIISVTPNTNNASEYFSLNSNSVSFNIDTFNYNDIVDINKNIDYFKVNNFKINFLSTPSNIQYSVNKISDEQNNVKVIDSITNDNKIKHDIDGRYLISFIAIDVLGRESYPIEKTFYIDTKLEYEIVFLNNDRFYKKNIELFASCSNNIKKIYYKFIEKPSDVENDLSNNTNYKTATAETINFNNQNLYGFKTEINIFESTGYKYLAYWVQEESSNISQVQFYKFLINNSNKLIPIFDYDNKVYYSLNDKIVNITWNSTNEEVKTFEIKLDKIQKNNLGEYEIIESYMPIANTNNFTSVGSGNNSFINIKEKKYFNLEFNDTTIVRSGIYKLTVKGHNIYNTIEENYFIFQIDYNKTIDLSNEIINNKISLQSNKLSWNYIDDAKSYQVSYDSKNWTDTVLNYFIIDEDKLIKDKFNRTFIYLRYINRIGIIQDYVKIEIFNNIKKIKPAIIKTEDDVLINNNKVTFTVEVPDVINSNFIYYSFDKVNWNVKEINGSLNYIDLNKTSPIPDGVYDIFVILTDSNPISNPNYLKSEMVHKSVKLFAKEIEKPNFIDLQNGSLVLYPKNLYIENKHKDIHYYIYINGKKVNEGFELVSQTIREFNIEVKAKKIGRNELITLIKNGDFKVNVSTGENYIIEIGNEKVVCNINSLDNTLEVINLNNLSKNQVVMFKYKNEENWKILTISTKLKLDDEYEFKIINFKVDNLY